MEQESAIAKVRNKLQPIVTYFELLRLSKDPKIDVKKRKILKERVVELEKQIQEKCMKDLLDVVKIDEYWTQK